jgi:hypothetical protein
MGLIGWLTRSVGRGWSRTLVLAAILIGLAIILLPRREDPPAPAPRRDSDPGAAPGPGETAPRDEPAAPRGAPSREPRAPADRSGAAPNEPDRDPAAELPIWERPPRTTAQPFPEAARFDPPMAPIRIPPWMIGVAGDAAVLLGGGAPIDAAAAAGDDAGTVAR